MNWTVEYRESGHYVIVTADGKFTVEDHRKLLEDVSSREFWRPGMNLFVDNRKLDFDDAGSEEIMQASINHSKIDALFGNGKTGILMKSISDFVLGREYEMLTDEKVSADLHIFLDEKQALRWLGV